jgi:outer membrane protein, multidrug efflux system
MRIKNINTILGSIILLFIIGCKTPGITLVENKQAVPSSYNNSVDTTNTATMRWKNFFKDPQLTDLIDTALKNNIDLQLALQDIEISKSEIRIRKGELLPSVGIGLRTSVDKVGTYTSQGAGDASAEITPGNIVPENLHNYSIAAYADWEIDIWKKLRNAKKAAVSRYLSTIEGKNFVITNLVAEVANNYYELLALDSQLENIRKNIILQNNALEIVKIQKESGRTTELAVQKFEAEVLSSKSMEYNILQNIYETQNRINFLLARYPQEIPRDKSEFLSLTPTSIGFGIPSQLLSNRPDIKQAENDLAAAKLDVKIARAAFYPTLNISAAGGLEGFSTEYLFKTPESMLYNLAGNIAAPLINRNAIKARFYMANARQLQAMYNYQRTILNGYLEVSNQLSKTSNLNKSYDLKMKQVEALKKAIDASNDLFKASRVDYFEVLMTQRDALQTKSELIDNKKDIMISTVNMYRNLGGGWR